MAGAVGAEACVVNTDVDGVFHGRPPALLTVGAEGSKWISDEGDARAGGVGRGGVQQPRAVEVSRCSGTRLHGQSTFTDETLQPGSRR